jgi:phosphoglycolate phosphatase-like HAD superfamily hydrolase
VGKATVVEAVLLDFDGVIVNTVAVKGQVFQAMMLERAPQQIEGIMSYYWSHGGVSRREKFRWIWSELLGRPLDSSTLNELADEFARSVRHLVLMAELVPGAEAFLAQYHEVWPCYVISGTPQAELRDLVRLRGLERYFRGVFGSPPDKVEIAQRILVENGYDRSRVWFVGDSTTDRDAARDLAVRFVGVAGPHLCPFLGGQEVVIQDLRQLADVLATP